MTLNSVMAVISRYFTEFGSFGANYVKVVQVRPTLSATKMWLKESGFWKYIIYSNIQRDCRERVR